ncbi:MULTISPECIES: hypothetical protein [unclassified Enterococcus]|uniref:hypothetical protein n=1 Tax=unclassified Enterococcus TaxID=2608891 RepID=UPI0013EA4B91|nr:MULTISPECIES: hypothetical protein [unclassified Enterococcus]
MNRVAAWIGLLFFACSFPIHALAEEQTTSEVGITFYPANKPVLVPMNKVEIAEDQPFKESSTETEEQALPKTAETHQQFMFSGICVVVIVGVFYSARNVRSRRRDEYG